MQDPILKIFSILTVHSREVDSRGLGSRLFRDDSSDRNNKKAAELSTAVISWSGQRDSNPRPSPWQGDALPAEPCPHIWFSKVGGDARIRTGGEGFAGLCLTTWPRRHPGVLSYKELVSYPTSSSKTMERTTGFEPATLTLAR